MVSAMPDPTPCPRCGADSRYLLTPRDRAEGLPASIRLCASRVCGVGFTDPAPKDVAAAPAASPSAEVEDRLASRIVSAGLAHLMRRLAPGATVVDVGAGSGIRARVLAERGFRVIAIEPDAMEEMRAHAMMSSLPAGTHVEMARAGVDDLPAVMDGRTAQAAVMWHVLEHLHQLDGGLGTVAGVLADGGLLSVAVPNRRSAEARAFGPRWHGWEPSRHRWHLDEDSLRLVLGASGFSVAEIGTRGGWGYPSGVAYSLAPGLDPQVHPGKGLLGRALAAAMIPVAATARAVGHGGQLVTIARRAAR
jgi:SAM-dependent methyltransferase